MSSRHSSNAEAYDAPEQRHRTQHPADAQKIMIAFRQPDAGSARRSCRHARTSLPTANDLQTVELQHQLRDCGSALPERSHRHRMPRCLLSTASAPTRSRRSVQEAGTAIGCSRDETRAHRGRTRGCGSIGGRDDRGRRLDRTPEADFQAITALRFAFCFCLFVVSSSSSVVRSPTTRPSFG